MERYVIDTFDFRTLHWAGNPVVNVRAPINGQSLVRVFLSGVELPVDDPLHGFDILPDTTMIVSGVAFQKIVLKQAMRMTRPLIEVCYTTLQETCTKCGGSGMVNDWTVDPSGALARVRGIEKLAQQALKYILTSKNPFNPVLTSKIRSYIGKKFGLSVTDADIAAEVTRVLSAYKQIQQAQKTAQVMEPHELLKDITSVQARQDPGNPLLVYISAVITAYAHSGTIALNTALQGN
jgi:hypothetical protein